MTAPFSVLVVCIGNVCRSPLAQHLLAARLDPARFAVASAGTRGLVGEPMEATAHAELRRLGGDADGFVARRLTPDLAREADLVLTATRGVRGDVVAASPAALKRTFTLRELALLVTSAEVGAATSPADLVARAASWRGSVAAGLDDELDVPDPIGRPADVHRAVADLLDTTTATIADALNQVG